MSAAPKPKPKPKPKGRAQAKAGASATPPDVERWTEDMTATVRPLVRAPDGAGAWSQEERSLMRKVIVHPAHGCWAAEKARALSRRQRPVRTAVAL